MRLVIAFLLFYPAPAMADCVIMLHGLARTQASFALMEKVLQTRGYLTVRPGYASTDLPIQALADQTLPPAFAACGHHRVHFVTHSMGGILLRYWLRDMPPERVGRVVMLGPPNQGSQLVDLLDDWVVFGLINGPAGKQLSTGETSVPRHLPPVRYPVGVIAGTYSLNPVLSALIEGVDDGKVAVSETRVAGMRDFITLPVTHTFMMNNPRVIAETVHFLETGRFHPAISWMDAVFGTIEMVCEGDDCPSDEQGAPSQ